MFAVFIELKPVHEGRPQYLIFPTPSGSTIFHRVSDGGKGGFNRWTITQTIEEGHELNREPATVPCTQRDVMQYQATGMASTLARKGIDAHLRSPETSLTTDDVAIQVIPALVATHDTSLNNWVRDSRRSRPLTATTKEIFVPNTNYPQPVSVGHNMSFVPDKEIAKRYVHRTISGQEDFAIFDWARANTRNILIYGPTGPGKTTCALAYAAKSNMPVAMVNGSGALEPSHFLGKTIFDEHTGKLRWQDGIITEVVRHGGMIILDEVNFMNGKIMTPLYPLLQYGTRHLTLLDHNGETVKAHPDVLIVATMNPHYAGTQEMNAAFRNRFSVQINWGYDDAVEQKLVAHKSLRDLARQLRAAEAKEEILTPTPTNALTEFAELATSLGMDFAISNFVSRYNDDEQSAVDLAIKAHRMNIEDDFGMQSAPVVEQEEIDSPLFDGVGDLTM